MEAIDFHCAHWGTSKLELAPSVEAMLSPANIKAAGDWLLRLHLQTRLLARQLHANLSNVLDYNNNLDTIDSIEQEHDPYAR